jgi:tRNA-2-methylthio-N6-dimethylallyladenosine synthase
MNLHDSEHIAGVLDDAGYSAAPDMASAAIVVFNTCSVRKSAEDRVWGNLGRLSSRTSRPIVAVCGCMARRLGDEMVESGRADIIFNMENLGELPALLERSSKWPVLIMGDPTSARVDELPSARRSSLRAWVPISHGCDNYCTYCVVPYVRGELRSRPSAEVLEEVRGLAADGVVEVTLLGQNVNSYGRDSGEEGFAEMLVRVGSVDGIERVKFETSHPRDLDDATLEAMAFTDAVCPHLHLPVQSGSDRTLAAMNRGYDAAYFLERVGRARSMVEDVAVTTDLIVGFPGETEEDFAATLDLVRVARFDAAYTFIYSDREGTGAAGMTPKVPADIAHERFDRLCLLQEESTLRAMESMVGRVEEVLIEGPARRGDMISGRTRGGKVVLLGSSEVEGEALVGAKITGSGKHAARGIIEEIIRRPLRHA